MYLSLFRLRLPEYTVLLFFCARRLVWCADVSLFPFVVPRPEKKKERKKTDNPREGWEDGTPPPHRDFKERRVWC